MKYAPRKVYIRESGGYVELSYTDFCRCRESDQTYMDKEEWAGTATELLAAMGETETVPTVITKWLNEYRTTFLSENRICYQYSRRKDGRQIALARREGDSGDGGDSDIGIPPVTVIDA